jgi:hypothetical protein
MISRYQPFTATAISNRGPFDTNPYTCWMFPTISRGALLSEYSTAFNVIDSVSFTEANWDGEGALPVLSSTKQNAKHALGDMLPVVAAPEINPNPNGTLSFEWQTSQGKAHMEIGNTRYSFYVSPKAGVAILHEGSIDDAYRLHGNLVASLLFPQTNGAETLTSIRYLTDVRTAA